jgi:hypothetical protein
MYFLACDAVAVAFDYHPPAAGAESAIAFNPANIAQINIFEFAAACFQRLIQGVWRSRRQGEFITGIVAGKMERNVISDAGEALRGPDNAPCKSRAGWI